MKLSMLYEALSGDERKQLAKKAGISAGYLWQLATRWNGKKPTVDLLAKLAEADRRLTVSDLVAEFAAEVEPAKAA